ncbi:DUF4124 domain-containing protein [Oxalobacteraceae bacterium OM1]|nr:DUF4124 domain-containing protein [Oxalobacteraceae bacterium OM1]
MNKLSFVLAAAAVAACQVAWAQTEIFACVDANGKTEYKNTGTTKGCKKLDLPGLTMIPAPKRAVAAQSGPTQTASAKPAASGPADFPKVDSNTQKTRDNDRRQILLDEMKTEEQKLANLKKDYNNGEPERNGDERNYAKYQERVAVMKEDIGRTERNIEALKRELNNLR